MAKYDSLWDRLMSHTAEPENGQACWEHDGRLNKKNGYPVVNIRVSNKVVHHYAHRLVYETIHGPVPEGHEVDHQCHNHRCINPDHLQALPIPDNRAKNRKPHA